MRKVQQSAKAAMGGWAGKLLVFMGGDTIMKFSNIFTAIGRGDAKRAIDIFTTFSLAEQAIMAAVVLSRTGLPDDEEEWKEFLITQGIGSFGSLIGGVPIIGNTVDYLVSKAGGGKYYANYGSELIPISGLFRNLERIGKWEEMSDEQKIQLTLQLSDQLAVIGVPLLSSSTSVFGQRLGALILSAALIDNPVSTWRKQIFEAISGD